MTGFFLKKLIFWVVFNMNFPLCSQPRQNIKVGEKFQGYLFSWLKKKDPFFVLVFPFYFLAKHIKKTLEYRGWAMTIGAWKWYLLKASFLVGFDCLKVVPSLEDRLKDRDLRSHWPHCDWPSSDSYQFENKWLCHWKAAAEVACGDDHHGVRPVRSAERRSHCPWGYKCPSAADDVEDCNDGPEWRSLNFGRWVNTAGFCHYPSPRPFRTHWRYPCRWCLTWPAFRSAGSRFQRWHDERLEWDLDCGPQLLPMLVLDDADDDHHWLCDFVQQQLRSFDENFVQPLPQACYCQNLLSDKSTLRHQGHFLIGHYWNSLKSPFVVVVAFSWMSCISSSGSA